MPQTPDTHPSGKPLPLKPAQTVTPSMGASGKRPDRTQPAPGGSRQEPAPNQGGQPSTSGQSGMTTAPGRAESHPLPARAVNQPPQVRVGSQQPWEVLPTFPQVEEEQVTVPGLTGT